MKCDCGRAFIIMDDLQLHRASCPALTGENFVEEQCEVTFRLQRNSTSTIDSEALTIIVSDLSDSVSLKQCSDNSDCYYSEKIQIPPGCYSGNLVVGDEILPLQYFVVEGTSQLVDIRTEPTNSNELASKHIVDCTTEMLSKNEAVISMNVNPSNNNNTPPTSPQVLGTVRTKYTLNRELALKKKMKGCDKPPYDMKENKDSTVIQLNTASFDMFTCAVLEHLENKPEYTVLPFDQQDQMDSITADIIRVHYNDAERSRAFTVNLYRTQNSVMVNGIFHYVFRDIDLPFIKDKIVQSSDMLARKNAFIKRGMSNTKIQPNKFTAKKRKQLALTSPLLKKYPSRNTRRSAEKSRLAEVSEQVESREDDKKVSIELVEEDIKEQALDGTRNS